MNLAGGVSAPGSETGWSLEASGGSVATSHLRPPQILAKGEA